MGYHLTATDDARLTQPATKYLRVTRKTHGGPIFCWILSSKYTDHETGLVNYGFRYYMPETGRWLGRDPIGEGGGWHLLAFLHNDPLNAVDLIGFARYASMSGAWSEILDRALDLELLDEGEDDYLSVLYRGSVKGRELHAQIGTFTAGCPCYKHELWADIAPFWEWKDVIRHRWRIYRDTSSSTADNLEALLDVLNTPPERVPDLDVLVQLIYGLIAQAERNLNAIKFRQDDWTAERIWGSVTWRRVGQSAMKASLNLSQVRHAIPSLTCLIYRGLGTRLGLMIYRVGQMSGCADWNATPQR